MFAALCLAFLSTYTIAISPLLFAFLHPCVDHSVLSIWSPLPFKFSSVQFSHSVASDSLWPDGLQHARLLCALPIPEACSNLCPSSRWCHPTIYLVLCHPLFFLPSIFPNIRVFSNESFFHSRSHSNATSISWVFKCPHWVSLSLFVQWKVISLSSNLP